jgi:triosephosphate isomerase (TIM)
VLTTLTVGVSIKAYLSLAETERWLARVAQLSLPVNVRLFVLPSCVAIGMAVRLLAGTRVQVGAQDVSTQETGPWTGEVTAAMLAEAGATLAEMGHSERRRLHGETDGQVAAKVGRSLAAGLTPVLCVGEPVRGSLAEAMSTVRQQLSRRLAQARPGSELVIAYEPEWAIGATEAAEPARIAAMTGLTRTVAGEAGLAARVLYGGSADRGLFSELSRTSGPAQCPDGLFLGRAGLDVANLATVIGELSQAAPGEAG